MDDHPGQVAPRRVRRELVVFVTVGLLALTVIAVGAVLIIGHVAQNQALSEDERITHRLAEDVITPLLGRALAGDPNRHGDLDRLVDNRIRDGFITEVNVWSADGQIVYSDDATKIGRRFPPPPEVFAAIELGQTTSAIETEPETGPAAEPRLVEVYVPLRLSDRVLAFEAYFSFRSVDAQTAVLTQQILPLAIGSLVLLQLIQIPIAVSLSRRVRRHEADRARLLERALSASERERKDIAAGLHDGVVQDLAGVSYAIGALSRSIPPERREITDRLGTTVRGAVETLRRLMVDIYPPDLSGSGLAAAVVGLTEPLREAGMTVESDIEPLPSLSPEVAATLYRTAREALTNVVKHAEAAVVNVRLAVDDDPRWRGRDAVRLRIVDDGIGLPPEGIDKRAQGHMGLHLLMDRLAEMGGELTVTTCPDGGTVADARVPAWTGPPPAGPATGRRAPRIFGVRRSPTNGSPHGSPTGKLIDSYLI
jgi:two-component system NarL family sensor kinase